MSARLKGVMGLVVLMWLLVDVHHVSAITAMDGVILSQRNYSSISCVIANLLFMNFTLPTMVQIDDVTQTPAKQLLVVQDPYVFTQEHVDFMERNVATAAMFIVVRASRVRECNAIHAVCCTYYWVTDAYPPGLSLSEVDPSLIMWNGTGTSMPLNLNYTKRFAAVDCSATNDSAVPPDLRRPPSQYPMPALVRIGARTPLVWDFYGRMRFIVASTYIEVPLHLNLENAETAAYIKGRMGELTAPIGDPWAILGADAMNFELAPGDSLVNVTRSGALWHIPVMVPIVVSFVLIVATVLFLVVTSFECEYRWRQQLRELQADAGSQHFSEEHMIDRGGHHNADHLEIDVEGTTTSSVGKRVPSQCATRYDSARKPSLASISSSNPEPNRASEMARHRHGHRRSSSLGDDSFQPAPPAPNPLASRPCTYLLAAQPIRTSSFMVPPSHAGFAVFPATAVQGLSTVPVESTPVQSLRLQAGSQRRVPSTWQPQSDAPYVMPNVPFVPSPETIVTPDMVIPHTQTSEAAGDTPADQSGSVTRRGSGLRRRNSTVSWNLRDIDM